VLRARLARRLRGPSVSDATPRELDALVGRYEAPGADEDPRVVRIDSAGPAARTVAAALRVLRRQGLETARARRRS
jgi:hypothetical protein